MLIVDPSLHLHIDLHNDLHCATLGISLKLFMSFSFLIQKPKLLILKSFLYLILYYFIIFMILSKGKYMIYVSSHFEKSFSQICFRYAPENHLCETISFKTFSSDLFLHLSHRPFIFIAASFILSCLTTVKPYLLSLC